MTARCPEGIGGHEFAADLEFQDGSMCHLRSDLCPFIPFVEGPPVGSVLTGTYGCEFVRPPLVESGSFTLTRTDAAKCADGWLDPGESCNDGNVLAGDGCDADCHLETARLQWFNRVHTIWNASGRDCIDDRFGPIVIAGPNIFVGHEGECSDSAQLFDGMTGMFLRVFFPFSEDGYPEWPDVRIGAIGSDLLMRKAIGAVSDAQAVESVEIAVYLFDGTTGE
jgi:cysteine-rich repeat protein